MKVHYRGLAKFAGQIVTQFALPNFFAGAQAIAAIDGRGPPVKREILLKTSEFQGQRSKFACFSSYLRQST